KCFQNPAHSGIDGFHHTRIIRTISTSIPVLSANLHILIIGALDGKMRCVIGNIQEKMRISVPSDKIHSTISDQVGQIPFGMKFLLIEVEIMFLVAFLMPEMIHIAAQNTKEFIKTMPERMILLPVAQVPFAEDASSIANLFQHGSDGHLAPGQTDG